MIRTILAWPCAVALAGLPLACPVQAQEEEDYRQIVIIMRACAQIDDLEARVACYDNNIAPRGPSVSATAALPAQASVAASAAAAPLAASSAAVARSQSFGSEDLPPETRPQQPRRADEISASVTSAVERQPGIYLLTLEDGAQWQFAESVPRSFDPPRRGSTIRIERNAVGGFLMKYDDQLAVRLQRVR